MTKLLFIASFALLLSACGSSLPSKTESAAKSVPTANGAAKRPPTSRVLDLTSVKPNNFNALATAYMNKMIRPMMKDPDSAKIKLSGKLEKEVCSDDKRRKYRTWNTLVGINAKNSYGAYVGMKPYKLFFVDGKVVAYAYGILLGSSVNGLTCVGMDKFKP